MSVSDIQQLVKVRDEAIALINAMVTTGDLEEDEAAELTAAEKSKFRSEKARVLSSIRPPVAASTPSDVIDLEVAPITVSASSSSTAVPPVTTNLANQADIVNLVSPDGRSSKRRRYSSSKFDPSAVQSIQEENHYKISAQIRAASAEVSVAHIEGYNQLRDYQTGWAKRWGIGEYHDEYVYINEKNPKAYILKNDPVLGVDFFLDPYAALAYAKQQKNEV